MKKTVIIIAHKISTLEHLDRIIVFNEGRIFEDATHEELISRNQYYAELWKTYYSKSYEKHNMK